jgi:DNA repair exonuclease SbcCD ATPase subunit
MNSLIPANSELMKSAIDVAKAQKELNVQMEAETPAVNDLTSSAKTTSVTYGELAAKIRAYASELEASADKEDAAKVAADAKASYISNLRTQLQSAKKDWQNYGKSASSGSKGSGGGGGGSSAADNVNEATEALEEQKKALQEAQKELEKYKQQLEDAKKTLEE